MLSIYSVPSELCFLELTFFLNWAIPGLFFIYFCLFYVEIQMTDIKSFADDRVRSADLWCRKWPLCQLRHNHGPFLELTLGTLRFEPGPAGWEAWALLLSFADPPACLYCLFASSEVANLVLLTEIHSKSGAFLRLSLPRRLKIMDLKHSRRSKRKVVHLNLSRWVIDLILDTDYLCSTK